MLGRVSRRVKCSITIVFENVMAGVWSFLVGCEVMEESYRLYRYIGNLMSRF